MRAEDAAARYENTFRYNYQKKNATVNGNVKCCAQDNINNNQNSVVQKKHKYIHAINKYLEKLMTREENY